MVVLRYFFGWWPAKLPTILNIVLMIGYCCIGQYFPFLHASYRHSMVVAHEDTSRYCRGACFTCVCLILPWHAGCCVGPRHPHVLSKNNRIPDSLKILTDEFEQTAYSAGKFFQPSAAAPHLLQLVS